MSYEGLFLQNIGESNVEDVNVDICFIKIRELD